MTTCYCPEQAGLPAAGRAHDQQRLPLTQEQVELLHVPVTKILSALQVPSRL